MCRVIWEHENIPRPTFGEDYQRHSYPKVGISAEDVSNVELSISLAGFASECLKSLTVSNA